MRSLLLLTCAVAMAADWPSYRGDPQLSGRQIHGDQITVETAKDVKLLWKQPLGETAVTSPLIMGPTITYRGVRELVFITTKDDLYAFDADLGKLFWKRHIDGVNGTPAFPPDPGEEARGEDEPGPMRPLYILSADGRLHAIRVSDGSDSDVVDFVPPGTTCSHLNYWKGVVYAPTKDGIWRLAVKPGSHAKLLHTAAPFGTVVAPDGSVSAAAQSLAGSPVQVHGVRFVLSDGVLKAHDAATGKELFSSRESVPGVHGELAVANGHICFASDTLYCFGIPIER